MLKDFLKNSAIYSIGRIIALSGGFITLPIATNALSPEIYGVFDLLHLCLVLLNLSVALEISQAIARFIPDSCDAVDKKKYISTAYFFSLFMYWITAFFLYAFQDTLSFWVFGTQIYADLFPLLSLWLFIHGSMTFVLNQFRWENKPAIHVVLQALNTVFLLGAISYFLIIEPASIKNLIYAYLCSSGACLIIGLYLLITKKIIGAYFSFAHLKAMLLFSSPLVFSSIAIFGQNYLDRIMISKMLSLSDVGLYAIAFKVTALLSSMTAVFQMSIIPLIYKNYKTEGAGENISQSFDIFIFFALSVIVGLTLFAPELYYFLIDERYNPSLNLLPFLLFAILFQTVRSFALGLGIKKKTHYTALISLFGFGLNAILNYVLIQKLGLTGAAIATVSTAIIITLFFVYFSQKHYYVSYRYGRIGLSILLCAGILYSFNTAEVELDWGWIGVKMGVVLISVSTFAFLLLPTTVWQFLKSRITAKNG